YGTPLAILLRHEPLVRKPGHWPRLRITGSITDGGCYHVELGTWIPCPGDYRCCTGCRRCGRSVDEYRLRSVRDLYHLARHLVYHRQKSRIRKKVRLSLSK